MEDYNWWCSFMASRPLESLRSVSLTGVSSRGKRSTTRTSKVVLRLQMSIFCPLTEPIGFVAAIKAICGAIDIDWYSSGDDERSRSVLVRRHSRLQHLTVKIKVKASCYMVEDRMEHLLWYHRDD